MQLIVNGRPQNADAQITLAELVPAVSDRNSGIAVAVNSEFVPRSTWSSTPLSEGDRVDVVTAVQGG